MRLLLTTLLVLLSGIYFNANAQLAAQYCNTTLPNLNSYIYCQAVPGAQRYQYEWENIGTGAITTGFSHSSAPTATFFSPLWVPGISYGQTYQVRVRTKIANVWGTYGASCLVITPGQQLTQLTSASCNTVLPSITGYLHCAAVQGAQRYQYEISGPSGYLAYGFSPSYSPTATWLSLAQVPGIRCSSTYTIRVRSKIGGTWGSYGSSCIVVTPAWDASYSGLTINSIAPDDATCNASNGSLQLNTSSGNTPLTYSWDAGTGNQTSATANNLAPGTYSVTVTDNTGCSVAGSHALIAAGTPTLSAGSATEESCPGNDGTATFTLSGGATPYSYLWSANSGSQTAGTATGLAADTYSVTATDANGCSATGSIAVVQDVSTVAISTTSTDATCFGGDGTLTATGTSASLPITYAWDAAAGNQSTATATGLAPGSYSVTATDAVGCTNSTSGLVALDANALALTTSVVDESCGSSNGSATAVASAGVAPYTYLWDASAGNQTTATAVGLAVGLYEVTVDDAQGCQISGEAIVGQNAIVPTITTSSSPETCIGNNGSVSLSIVGGTDPWTYQWSANANGQTTAGATGLAADLYTVSATDATGCQLIATQTVDESCSPLSSAKMISGGQEYTLMLCDDGSVWAVGKNDFGQLGIGSYTHQAHPKRVLLPGPAVAVQASVISSAALLADGTVWQWGFAGSNGLGQGASTYDHDLKTNIPLQVKRYSGGGGVVPLDQVVSISFRHAVGLALRADSTVWGWGSDFYGIVPTTPNRHAAKQIPNLEGITHVATSSLTFFVVKSDGTAWAWGRSDYGERGTGDYGDSAIPLQVPTVTNVKKIVASAGCVLLLQHDGLLYSAGWNTDGRMGRIINHSSQKDPFPAVVPNVPLFADIDLARTHTVAMTLDSSAWAWGENFYDQLGLLYPDLLDQLPHRIGEGTPSAYVEDVVAIAAGEHFTYLRKADGTQIGCGELRGGYPGGFASFAQVKQYPQQLDEPCAAAAACAPATLTFNESPAVCGQSDGALGAVITGGTAPFSYLWNGSGGQTTLTAPGLATGHHFVQTTDADGCVLGGSHFLQEGSNVQQTQLATSSCGYTATSLADSLYCDPVAGVQRYQYDITGPNGFHEIVFSQSSATTSTYMVLSWLDNLELGTTYQARVRAKVAGCWGVYSSVCEFTTPAGPPTTQLSAASCGITMTTLNQYLYGAGVIGAERYQYQVSLGGSVLGTTFSLSSAPTSTFFTIYHLSGVAYNTTYDVRVRVKTAGVWGPYGPVCQITTPPLDIPELQPQFCGSGMAHLSDYFYTTPVAGVQRYQYEFSDGAGFLAYAFSYWGSPTSTWMAFSLVPGVQLSTTYNVRVRAKIAGVWESWGPSCPLTTPATSSKAELASVLAATTSLQELTLTLAPNPASDAATLRVHNAPTDAITVVEVFDLTGRKVLGMSEQSSVVTLQGLNEWPSGVYLIKTAVTGQQAWTRLVVQ